MKMLIIICQKYCFKSLTFLSHTIGILISNVVICDRFYSFLKLNLNIFAIAQIV